MLDQFLLALKLPLAEETGQLAPVSVGGVRVQTRWESRVCLSHAGRDEGRRRDRERVPQDQWFMFLDAPRSP